MKTSAKCNAKLREKFKNVDLGPNSPIYPHCKHNKNFYRKINSAIFMC